MKVVLFELLSNPLICGIAMALVTWCILDFWGNILTYKRKIHPVFMVVVAALNGLMSFFAEIYTNNNASPRTIALYVPVMILLQILIFGHLGKWGTLFILVFTSFLFITLYSVCIGVSYFVIPSELMESRVGLVIPVTATNILMTFLLLQIKVFSKTTKESRFGIIGEILSKPKTSITLFLYMFFNSVAVTYLCYGATDIIYNTSNTSEVLSHTALSLIIRDSILFLSSILILDFQSRNALAEKKATDAISKNILLEKDRQTQMFIRQGLEEAKKKLEEDNKKLGYGIEYERKLRNQLRRNVLCRFSANISKNVMIETGALTEFGRDNGESLPFNQMSNFFINLLIDPENRNEMRNKMSTDYLMSLVDTENNGFNISFKISPKEFMKQVVLDDDSSKIYKYMDREYIWSSIECSVARNEDGDIYAYFYLLDVDEQKQNEENIKKAADTDALTGLNNRRAFERDLQKYLTDADASGTLFMFDLDYFKSVNDNLGHPKGDELLKTVADILKNTFRPSDILCRIGGDEFCAFAKGFTDESHVMNRAELLNEKGRMSFDNPNGKSVNVSFSIGVAVYPKDANDAKTLYKNADLALYNAKESGRNCYKMFS